jgi:uncharacterized protein (TIGR04255 family)
MFAAFPVKRLERLPSRIDPCPIVEAAFEVRFTTEKPLMLLPGLVSGLLENKYPEQKELPLAANPELRKMIAGSAFLPHYQFLSEQYCINLGPQVIGLCIRQGRYPGWGEMEKELRWLMDRILAAGFMVEGDRLGVRYGDFFTTDIFQHIELAMTVNGETISDEERQVVSVFKQEGMNIRLMITNSAVMDAGEGPKQGSIFDVDVSFGALDFDLDTSIMDRFAEAHTAIKQLFFGLIKPDFLTTLNPTYT